MKYRSLFYENVYLPGAYFLILFKAIIASPKSTKVSAIIKSAFPFIANSICSCKIFKRVELLFEKKENR